MVIAFPRAVPDDLLVAGFSFPPLPVSEVTPLRSGKQISKDLGPTLWRGSWRSVEMPPEYADEVRAWYDTLLSIREFYGFDHLKQYPRAYALGWGDLTVGGDPFSGNCRLTAVAENVVEVSLDSLPVGFKLSRGDYLAWDYLDGAARALHRASTPATADGDGKLTVEVRPFIRDGWAVNATVMLYRAAARMIILPGTYSEQIAAPDKVTISFEAVQTL